MISLTHNPLTAKNDLLFKKVFGSPRYSHILIGFLRDILQLDIEEVTIENPYDISVFRKQLETNKVFHTEVDLVARLQDQTIVTIELQINPQLYYCERAFYYLSQKYISNYGRHDIIRLPEHQHGAKYSSLHPVYSLSILDYTLFPQDIEILRHFTMYETELKQFLLTQDNRRLVTMSFFELQKQSDSKVRKHVQYWMDYFNKGSVDKAAPNYLQEATTVINDHNLEEGEKNMIDALEKAREDYKGNMQYSRIEGIEIGIEENRLYTAKQLLTEKVDWAIITRVTGFTEEQLLNLS